MDCKWICCSSVGFILATRMETNSCRTHRDADAVSLSRGLRDNLVESGFRSVHRHFGFKAVEEVVNDRRLASNEVVHYSFLHKWLPAVRLLFVARWKKSPETLLDHPNSLRTALLVGSLLLIGWCSCRSTVVGSRCFGTSCLGLQWCLVCSTRMLCAGDMRQSEFSCHALS